MSEISDEIVFYGQIGDSEEYPNVFCFIPDRLLTEKQKKYYPLGIEYPLHEKPEYYHENYFGLTLKEDPSLLRKIYLLLIKNKVFKLSCSNLISEDNMMKLAKEYKETGKIEITKELKAELRNYNKT